MVFELSAEQISFWMNLAIGWGLKLLGALGILLATWILSRWASKGTARALEGMKVDATITRFTGSIASWGVLVIGGVVALQTMGVHATSFIALLGAAGFAIGLALQGTLSHFAAGIMLLVFRPFKVGDHVKIASISGIVYEVDLIFTKIDTFDNRRLTIPNGEIFGNSIENLSYHPKRRTEVAVGTDYNADLHEVRATLERAAKRVILEQEGALGDPAPMIYVDALADSSINWYVRVWAEQEHFIAVREAVVHAVKEELDAAGINIPFPQMDLNLRREG